MSGLRVIHYLSYIYYFAYINPGYAYSVVTEPILCFASVSNVIDVGILCYIDGKDTGYNIVM